MNYVIKEKYSPLVIIRRLLMFSVPAIVLFNLFYSVLFNSQRDALINEYTISQRETVHIISYSLQSVFNETYHDLLILKNSNEFSDYLADSNEYRLNEVRKMFKRVARSKPNFEKIQYINTDGMEVARVNNIDGAQIIVAKENLQDKSERYYIESAMHIPEGAMYISDIDMTAESNSRLVLRFATPVYENGELMGIIVINYDGYKILSILDEYTNENNNLAQIGIFDSASLWEYEKDAQTQKNVLHHTDIKQMLSDAGFSPSESDEDNYFDKNNTLYHMHLLSSPSEFDIVFESDYYKIGVLGSFNIDTILKNSTNVILQKKIIPVIFSLFIVGVAIIIIILSYMLKADSLMLTAAQYISEDTHDAIIIADRNKKVIYCNSVFEDVFGYSLDDIKDNHMGDFLKESVNIALEDKDGKHVWQGNIWETTKNKIYLLRYLKMRLIIEKKNDLAYYIGIYSEPKTDKALLDSSGFYASSSKAASNIIFSGLEKAFNIGFDKHKQNIAIAIKINDLSNIKNTISEHEAQCFLADISKRLIDSLGEETVIVSPGSDFIFVRAPFYKSEGGLQDLIAAMDKIFSEIKFADKPSVSLSYLSGIAISPGHGTTGIEIIKKAYVSLEAIIKLKKSNYLVYNDYINEIIKKDKEIRNELKYAFQRNEFSVLYQVQKSVEGKNTGAEALVRWTSAKLGEVPPTVFVPIMEESEYIKKLGLFVLNKVIEDFSKIKDLIPGGFKISINLSSREFIDEEVVASLVDIIEASDLMPESFCFEITETTLVNNLAHTNEIIEFLHGKNIIVSIDDFGTGFSSLGYLKALYADKLKIDRTFIKGYPEHDDGTLLKAIISLANQLKIDVLVEGVENQTHLDLIKSVGCKEYQGYFGSKPLKFEEFVQRFLEKA